MVYYGKLSKGCERCRRLKVRCDQRKPGCSRCERTKAACPGYRNLVDFLFRDDSAGTVKRNRRDAARERLNPTEYGQIDATASPLNLTVQDGPFFTCSPMHSLPQRPGEVAAVFYFRNFTIQDPPLSGATSRGTILKLLDSPTALVVIEAIGLAAISNIRGDQRLLQQARARYSQALRGTNAALDDPAQAACDATAMAVLLLSQFERMYLDSRESVRDGYRRWVAHVQGASALLGLRGQEQFTREAGLSLFFAIRLQVVSVFHICSVLDLTDRRIYGVVDRLCMQRTACSKDPSRCLTRPEEGWQEEARRLNCIARRCVDPLH